MMGIDALFIFDRRAVVGGDHVGVGHLCRTVHSISAEQDGLLGMEGIG